MASGDLRCTSPNHYKHRIPSDDKPTNSHGEQHKVEDNVGNCFLFFKTELRESLDMKLPQLQRRRHEAFLLKGIQHLSSSYECLDASMPWLCYWILHSLELLETPLPEHLSTSIAQFLGKCQHPNGGFGGGPLQHPHLAPTYAAVNALCILGTEEAYNIINRKTLKEFLTARRTPEGAFTMHEGGEVDIRGAYCAASAARLTNTFTTEMFEGTAEWIVRCQTYEGGFAGCPGAEAHGGYSFCGLAALVLLGHERLCDIEAVLRWTAFRQMPYEGGFQGRANKLVDGCYSFWQGGVFPLIHLIMSKEENDALDPNKWMFHQGALQEYILTCCQHPGGGLIDKPGKARDYYHTCYCLSGLSVAQHFNRGKLTAQNVIGDPENELKPTHPVYNIGLDAAYYALHYFKKQVPPQEL